MKLGLQAKILGATVLVVGMSFGAVWGFATGTAREGLVRLSDDNLDQSVLNLSRAIRGVLEDARADSVATASLDLAPEVLESGDPKNFVFFADQLVRTKPKYAAIVVTARKDGRIVAASTIDRSGRRLTKTLVGKKVAAPWLGKTYASCQKSAGGTPATPTATWVPPARPPFLAAALKAGETVVGYSVPVRDLMAECIGAVTVFVSMHFLADRILNGYVGRSQGGVDSLAAIADSAGTTLLLPRGLERWQDVSLGGTRAKSAREAATIRGPDGSPFHAVPASLELSKPAVDWSVIQLTRMSKVEAPIERIGTELLVVFAAALLLTLGVLALLAARFLGPVRELTAVVSATSKASDFKSLPVKGEDEVGELTHSFNRMFETIRGYEEDLEDKVAQRTSQLAAAKREVSDILDNMSQGIFTINSQGKVNEEFSAYCKQIFGSDLDIAGSDALQLLQAKDALDEQSYGRMNLWLKHIVGADELQWMLSEDEPVKELDYRMPQVDEAASASQKRLRLEYAPIYDGDTIAKVMVVAKDVTALSKLEAEVDEKEREKQQNLSLMAELTSMDPALFETFIEESNVLLDNCSQTVDVLADDPEDAEAINTLFRIMHTLKGNARIFRIASVQDRAHEVEAYFEKIRGGKERVTPAVVAEVRTQIRTVRKLVAEFERLGRRILLGQVELVDGRETPGPGDMRSAVESSLADAEAQLVGLEELRDPEQVEALLAVVDRVSEEARRCTIFSTRSLLATLTHELTALPDAVDVAYVAKLFESLADVTTRLALLETQVQTCADSESFGEEVERVRRHFYRDLVTWLIKPGAVEPINSLLRQAHTLKATARDAGIEVVQQQIHLFEGRLAELRDDSTMSADACISAAAEQLAQVDALLDDCMVLIRRDEALRGAPMAFALDDAVSAIGKAIRVLQRGKQVSTQKERRRDVVRVAEVLEGAKSGGFGSLGLELERALQRLNSGGDAPQALVSLATDLYVLMAHAVRLRLMTRRWVGGDTHDVFLAEAEQRVEVLRKTQKTWEEIVADKEKLNQLLRSVHSLKASARSHGFHVIQEVVHLLENKLCAIRDSQSAPAADQVADAQADLANVQRMLADAVAIHTQLRTLSSSGGTKRRGRLAKVPEVRVLELRRAFKDARQAVSERQDLPSEVIERFESMGVAIQGLTMVPLSDMFERFRKMVLDLSRELDKPIDDLVVTGDDIEVDVKLAERMRDVLLHALRNCVDHGIEPRGERPESKPQRGRIQVHCSWQGKDLVFEVVDDGRGIDPDAVRARAFEKGLIQEEQVDAMPDEEVAELLFLPGFSMAKKITDVSGRGVGMDVIRSTMIGLKGDAAVTSRFGEGTRLTLRIPSDYYQQL